MSSASPFRSDSGTPCAYERSVFPSVTTRAGCVSFTQDQGFPLCSRFCPLRPLAWYCLVPSLSSWASSHTPPLFFPFTRKLVRRVLAPTSASFPLDPPHVAELFPSPRHLSETALPGVPSFSRIQQACLRVFV